MNDFAELEAELKKLRPVAVSNELESRIARALEREVFTATAGILPPARSTAKNWWSFSLALAGLAALLLVGLNFLDRPASEPTAIAKNTTPVVAGFQPTGLSQVVYSGRDEGLVFPPNDIGAPRHRLRYETRETVHWRNAQTGASVRVSYPVEQVVLTPVSFQ